VSISAVASSVHIYLYLDRFCAVLKSACGAMFAVLSTQKPRDLSIAPKPMDRVTVEFRRVGTSSSSSSVGYIRISGFSRLTGNEVEVSVQHTTHKYIYCLSKMLLMYACNTGCLVVRLRMVSLCINKWHVVGRISVSESCADCCGSAPTADIVTCV
jgi:hypothetical protein